MPPRWMQSKLSKIRRQRKDEKYKVKSGGVDPTKTQAYDIYNNQQRVRSAHGRKNERLPDQDNTFMHVDKAMELEKLRDRLKLAIANGNTKEYNATNRRIRELEKVFAPPPKKIVDPDDPWDYWVDEEGNERRTPNKVPRETVKPEWYELELQREAERQEVTERKDRIFLRSELLRIWHGKRGHGVEKYIGAVIERAGAYSLTLYFSGNEWVFVQEVGEDRWISLTYTREQAHSALAEQRIAWIIQDKVPKD